MDESEKKNVLDIQPNDKGKQKSKFFKKGSQGPENAGEPLPPPQDSSSSTGSKPTRLSTATKITEPLFSDLDILGFPGITPYRRFKEFAITAEGFVPLVEIEYDVIAIHQPKFSNMVPKSAWVYYCVMNLYARLVNLRQEEGHSTYEEDSFANEVLSGNHKLPYPIEAYIKGLGHVVDSASLRYKLRTPAWPNQDGDFGRVAPATHWMYMSMPCPRVCAMRIQEDLRVTATPGVREWNLPQKLRPTDREAGNPTRNCLGWARAVTLTSEQVAFVESTNVMDDVFPTKFRQFQYSQDLFERVSKALSMTEKKIKIAPQTPETSEGSIAQVCWSRVEPINGDVSSNVFYSESNKVQIVASTQLDAGQVFASLILSYRVRKDEMGERRPYCVYDFGGFKKVPQVWHETRNAVFEYGNCDRWNEIEFTSPFDCKSKYRLAWLKRHVN